MIYYNYVSCFIESFVYVYLILLKQSLELSSNQLILSVVGRAGGSKKIIIIISTLIIITFSFFKFISPKLNIVPAPIIRLYLPFHPLHPTIELFSKHPPSTFDILWTSTSPTIIIIPHKTSFI